jgi:hypothetical protein
MLRNVLAVTGTVTLLTIVAPPSLPSAGRDLAAAQHVEASPVPRLDVEAHIATDWTQKARQDWIDDMQALFRETCGACCEPDSSAAPPQAAVQVGSARSASTGEGARPTDDPALCQPIAADYLVAVVPDPVHTHLALMFDRLVDTVQQGLQDSGYQYIRAVIPWDHGEHTEPPAFESRLAVEDYEAERAKLPGLMAFRKPGPPDGQRRYLFVFLVGESPTGGIVKPQFHTAIEWIKSAKTPLHGLRILGPTFSGSLASLAELLGGTANPGGPSFIFSGAVSGRSAVTSFKCEQDKFRATFVSFHEADDAAIKRFLRFLAPRGFGKGHIAILSEDESGYGGFLGTPACKGHEVPDADACGRCLRMYFPREISRLRAAYQGLAAKQRDAGIQSAPREILPLNLEISGAEGDTVPAFSKQITLSQEGVLLGIVSELRKHDARIILLRATDPLDLLFLSRYLTGAYPQGRIVTLGADLLFPREVEDKQLHGILALVPYAPSPSGNHEFRNYAEQAERMFPTAEDAGTYNAVRALALMDPEKQRRQDPWQRYELGVKDLDLYQYGWAEASVPGSREANTPPVHVLALGADGYWPLAHLGPSASDTWLPIVAGKPQLQPDSHFVFVLPISWKVANLAALGLALGFALSLWSASLRSSTAVLVQLAPPSADARAPLIGATAVFFLCIFSLLLKPLLTGGLSPIEHALAWGALSFVGVLTVLAAAGMDLLNRKRLTRAHGKRRAKGNARTEPNLLFSAILLAGGLLLALWWIAQGFSGEASVRRFAMLRSLQLTSGLSPALPILLMLGAGLWWAYYVVAGSVLLVDGRRPQLPKGATQAEVLPLTESDGVGAGENGDQKRAAWECHQAAGLARQGQTGRAREYVNYAVTELLDTLRPCVSPISHYLALVAIACGVWLLLNAWRPLMTLEEPTPEGLLSILYVASLVWIAGTTTRLGGIWLKARRLLVLLDSRPLRDGFKQLEGFSGKTLWRMSLVTSAEFQKLLAHAREALVRANNTKDLCQDLTEPMTEDLLRVRETWERLLVHGQRDHLSNRQRRLSLADRNQAPKRRLSLKRRCLRRYCEWSRRRRTELDLIASFRCFQYGLAMAAGRGLDFLARQWHEEKERPKQRFVKESDSEAERRAWGQFVCLVYVNFLLAVLMRIRSLMMAIGGMYILVMVGMNSYPFQPRATIAALSGILLLYIIATVTVVFAQMNRDNTLSHLTKTTPGELGKDFWIRTGSFAALPLLSYLVAQFPQINRFLYSWIEPAVHALNK